MNNLEILLLNISSFAVLPAHINLNQHPIKYRSIRKVCTCAHWCNGDIFIYAYGQYSQNEAREFEAFFLQTRKRLGIFISFHMKERPKNSIQSKFQPCRPIISRYSQKGVNKWPFFGQKNWTFGHVFLEAVISAPTGVKCIYLVSINSQNVALNYRFFPKNVCKCLKYALKEPDSFPSRTTFNVRFLV